MKRRKSIFSTASEVVPTGSLLRSLARTISCGRTFAVVVAAGLLSCLGGKAYAQERTDSLTVRTENNHRKLDRREHLKYQGWRKVIPTHAKVQYAGGMGFMSFGAGWDYGRKGQWETDVMIGYLPKRYSDKFHMTFTLKQNYIPWSVDCGKNLAFEPLACGMYVNYISGEEFWVREPDRYPGSKYYGFTSRSRFHVFMGERLTYYIKGNRRCGDCLVRNISLFYEFSANDLNIISKSGNRSLPLSDIIFFSAGVKIQLMR